MSVLVGYASEVRASGPKRSCSERIVPFGIPVKRPKDLTRATGPPKASWFISAVNPFTVTPQVIVKAIQSPVVPDESSGYLSSRFLWNRSVNLYKN